MRSARSLLLALATLSTLAPDAIAQDSGFSVEGLELLPAPSRNLVNVSESSLLTHMDVASAVASHYSGGTLMSSDGARHLVGDRLTVEPSVAMGLWDFASVGLSVPLVTSQTGAQVDGFALGDVRLTPQLRLVDPAWAGGFGVHLTLPVYLPSGDPAAFTGDGGLRTRPTLGMDWRHRRSGLALSVNAGWEFRPTRRVDGLTSAAALHWSAGVELPTGRAAHFLASAFGRVSFGDDLAAGDPQIPVELIGGLAVAPTRRVSLTFAGGAALVADRRTPDLRLLISVSYSFLYDRDSDRDGLLEGEDNCPDLAEDYDGYQDHDGCPEDDNDGDGVYDADDLCPEEEEDDDGFQDEDGCPDLDNDDDGVADEDDACDGQREDRDGFEDDDGCPDPDNDGDGFLDVDDRCPDVPEDFDGIGDDDGCFEVDFDDDGFYDSEDDCPEQAEDMDGREDDDGCPE